MNLDLLPDEVTVPSRSHARGETWIPLVHHWPVKSVRCRHADLRHLGGCIREGSVGAASKKFNGSHAYDDNQGKHDSVFNGRRTILGCKKSAYTFH